MPPSTSLPAFRPAVVYPDCANESVVFQTLDWTAEDTEEFVDEEGETPDMVSERYVITAYGVNSSGNSVALKVQGFMPFFYVELPDDFTRYMLDRLASAMQSKVQKRHQEGMASAKLVHKKKLVGFTNDKLYKFGEVKFFNKRAMWAYFRLLDEPLNISGIGKLKLAAWESNIDPLLRFTHVQDLRPCGWLRLEPGKYDRIEYNPTRCQLLLTTHCSNVLPDRREDVAPVTIAAFDIEADSSHGDFPQGKKDYSRLALDISNYISECVKNKQQQEETINLREILKMAFTDAPNDAGIAFVYTKAQRMPMLDCVESLIQAVDSEKILVELAALKRSKLAKVAAAKVSELEAGEKLATGIDRLTARLTQLFDQYLPEVCGDRVTQIGTVLGRYGDINYSFKHIITLGTCDPIDGVIVESYKTEKEVLLAWTRLIQAVDPDITTQWNGMLSHSSSSMLASSLRNWLQPALSCLGSSSTSSTQLHFFGLALFILLCSSCSRSLSPSSLDCVAACLTSARNTFASVLSSSSARRTSLIRKAFLVRARNFGVPLLSAIPFVKIGIFFCEFERVGVLVRRLGFRLEVHVGPCGGIAHSGLLRCVGQGHQSAVQAGEKGAGFLGPR